jgi:hypothetical protein
MSFEKKPRASGFAIACGRVTSSPRQSDSCKGCRHRSKQVRIEEGSPSPPTLSPIVLLSKKKTPPKMAENGQKIVQNCEKLKSAESSFKLPKNPALIACLGVFEPFLLFERPTNPHK